MGNDSIDPDLYDISKLYPKFGNIEDYRGWLLASKITTSTVGLIARFWMRSVNTFRIHNAETLYDALENRPADVPLITYANHHSCMDEPLLWGCLKVRHSINNSLMRWAPAAHNICYTRWIHSQFFALGKSIPFVRGAGVNQPGVDFAIDRLNEGSWLHIYPEGKVNMNPKEDIRFKWGIGRMIAECEVTPIVIPIYHLGMDSILPNNTPYIPRIGQKVTMVVGEPIPMEGVLKDLKQRNAGDQEKRKVLTDHVQSHLRKLKITAQILHAKNLWKP